MGELPYDLEYFETKHRKKHPVKSITCVVIDFTGCGISARDGCTADIF